MLYKKGQVWNPVELLSTMFSNLYSDGGKHICLPKPSPFWNTDEAAASFGFFGIYELFLS